MMMIIIIIITIIIIIVIIIIITSVIIQRERTSSSLPALYKKEKRKTKKRGRKAKSASQGAASPQGPRQGLPRAPGKSPCRRQVQSAARLRWQRDAEAAAPAKRQGARGLVSALLQPLRLQPRKLA